MTGVLVPSADAAGATSLPGVGAVPGWLVGDGRPSRFEPLRSTCSAALPEVARMPMTVPVAGLLTVTDACGEGAGELPALLAALKAETKLCDLGCCRTHRHHGFDPICLRACLAQQNAPRLSLTKAYQRVLEYA